MILLHRSLGEAVSQIRAIGDRDKGRLESGSALIDDLHASFHADPLAPAGLDDGSF
jgi:hypothetical protein